MFWTCSGHVPKKFWGSKMKFFQKVWGMFGLYFGIIRGVCDEVKKAQRKKTKLSKMTAGYCKLRKKIRLNQIRRPFIA